MEMIKIKRRPYKGTAEIVETVQLIKRNKASVIVQLADGNIIKRKMKDVING